MRRQNGIVIAIVKDVNDPAGEGRVQLEYPWLPGSPKSAWAPVAVPLAGKDRGMWYMPEPGDQAVVAFEQGDFAHPFVVGFVWDGVQVPPDEDHRVRLIRSLNDHRIEIYDPDAKQGDLGYIRIEDAHGNLIELANARITIRSVAALEIQAPSVSINGRPVAPVPNPI
jgi:uncharacterized protein involved in type VI secretion and phage assembly